MFACHRLRLFAVQVGLQAALILASAGAQAASDLAANNSNASASVDIRVVIPRILQLLENSHPPLLPVQGEHDKLLSEQRIVMLSTLRNGFCMDMKLATHQVASWKLQLKDSTQARVEAIADGYRVCVSRAGRHELALSHNFGLASRRTGVATLDWPVDLSLSAP